MRRCIINPLPGESGVKPVVGDRADEKVLDGDQLIQISVQTQLGQALMYVPDRVLEKFSRLFGATPSTAAPKCPCDLEYDMNPADPKWYEGTLPPQHGGPHHEHCLCFAPVVPEIVPEAEMTQGPMGSTRPQAFMAETSGGEDDPPGLAILDTACQRTMNGSRWRARYEAELKERGFEATVQPTTCTITGVGGSTTAQEAVRWPVGLAGKNGIIEAVQLEQDLPFLLRLAAQTDIGVIMDLTRGVVDFKTLGIYGLPLRQATLAFRF